MDEAVKIAEIEQRCKSNTHRLDELEQRQENLDELATTMSVMANEQDHIKADVGVIKADVKKLTDKPGLLWDKLVWLVVSGVAGYLLAQIIK